MNDILWSYFPCLFNLSGKRAVNIIVQKYPNENKRKMRWKSTGNPMCWAESDSENE